MMILLGDRVTVRRTIAGTDTYITGQISGLVLNDNGDLRYFYIKGIDGSIWMQDGWVFDSEEYEIEMGGDDDNDL